MWMSWGQFADCIALPCCFTVVKNFSIRFCCLWLTQEKLFDKRSFRFSTVLMLSEQSIDRHRLLPSLRSSLYQSLLVQSFLLLFAQLIWISAWSFLCFVFVFTHLVSCFVCAPSLSVYWHEQSKRLAKHEKSTCIRWQIEQRWDEFTTTEQRTTTTSTDWVVPKTFETFDALIA